MDWITRVRTSLITDGYSAAEVRIDSHHRVSCRISHYLISWCPAFSAAEFWAPAIASQFASAPMTSRGALLLRSLYSDAEVNIIFHDVATFCIARHLLRQVATMTSRRARLLWSFSQSFTATVKSFSGRQLLMPAPAAASAAAASPAAPAQAAIITRSIIGIKGFIITD
jgi:hypothetical protein